MTSVNNYPKYINTLKSEKFTKFAKGAAGAVVGTTILKAVGRPVFIYKDKTAEPEARKYSAAKELLYQVICLAIALASLSLAAKGGYKLAQKLKGDEVEKIFKRCENPESFVVNKKTGKTKELSGVKRFLKEYEEAEQPSKEMKLIKGSVEFCSLVGSVIGLTIIAPLVSHKILHPVMHAIGLEKKPGTPEPEVDLGDQALKTKNVDVKG